MTGRDIYAANSANTSRQSPGLSEVKSKLRWLSLARHRINPLSDLKSEEVIHLHGILSQFLEVVGVYYCSRDATWLQANSLSFHNVVLIFREKNYHGPSWMSARGPVRKNVSILPSVIDIFQKLQKVVLFGFGDSAAQNRFNDDSNKLRGSKF